jgi:hypothetical protein
MTGSRAAQHLLGIVREESVERPDATDASRPGRPHRVAIARTLATGRRAMDALADIRRRRRITPGPGA